MSMHACRHKLASASYQGCWVKIRAALWSADKSPNKKVSQTAVRNNSSKYYSIETIILMHATLVVACYPMYDSLPCNFVSLLDSLAHFV